MNSIKKEWEIMPDFHFRIKTKNAVISQDFCIYEECFVKCHTHDRHVVIYANNQARAKEKLFNLYPDIIGEVTLLTIT